MEATDPTIAMGYQELFVREVPVELRTSSSPDDVAEAGALELIRFRVLSSTATASGSSGSGNVPEAYRVELSSNSNLFFHYEHSMTQQQFKQLQEEQRLMVDFAQYTQVLAKMLNHCGSEPQAYLAILIMSPTGTATLDFIHNVEYKFVELLSLRLRASPEQYVRAHVGHKYSVAVARVAAVQAQMAELMSLVKLKSPSLLLQLQKSSAAASGRASPGSQRAGSPIKAAPAGSLAAQH